MHWLSPWWFLLFLLLLPWVWWKFFKFEDVHFRFSSLKNLHSMGIRSYVYWLPSWLKIVALGFLIVALARPQSQENVSNNHVYGVDILAALDVSDSMLIEDMKPNRLEKAKETISNFVKKRNSDRMGLIVFAGESYTRIPLTIDYLWLLENLKQVKTSSLVKPGTAIGMALANAALRFRNSKNRTKVLILLTDGENNAGVIDPETAMELLVEEGVRVYTIGVGRDGDAAIPRVYTLPSGRKVKRFSPIHSKVNETLLKKIAKETNGKYFRATNGRVLDGIFAEIDQLEKTKVDVQGSFVRRSELFMPYALWALVLYALGCVLGHTILRYPL